MSRTCTGPVLHPSGGGAAMDMRPATSFPSTPWRNRCSTSSPRYSAVNPPLERPADPSAGGCWGQSHSSRNGHGSAQRGSVGPLCRSVCRRWRGGSVGISSADGG